MDDYHPILPEIGVGPVLPDYKICVTGVKGQFFVKVIDPKTIKPTPVKIKKKKKNRSGSKHKKTKRLLLWRQNPHCKYCNKRLKFPDATVDHVIPVSKGGGNKIKNLAVSCYDCNQEKGNMSVEEFERKRALKKNGSIVSRCETILL